MQYHTLLPLLLGSLLATPGLQSADVDLFRQWAVVDFPLSITFHVEAGASQEIAQAVVRFRIEERSCAQVESIGYGEVVSGPKGSAQWTWNMRRSGGLPPGSIVHFSWEITDIAGIVTESVPTTVEIVDQNHEWRSMEGDGFTFHWYRGDERFTSALAESAQEALARLEASTGVSPDRPIQLYIYGSAREVQNALVFPQEWTGGVAFNSFNTVALGIEPESLVWGRRALAHELTHVIIGQVTHNCYRDIPTWLSEGLATYNEGDLSRDYASALERAVDEDRLFSVRSLSGAFPTSGSDAVLAYGESWSLLDYLVSTYGPQKLDELFAAFRSGSTADDALRQVYGLDQAGLDREWRRFLGAASYESVASGETPVPTAPAVSTFEPFSLASPSPSGETATLTATPGSVDSTPRPGGGGCSWGVPLASSPGKQEVTALLLPAGPLTLGLFAINFRRRKR